MIAFSTLIVPVFDVVRVILVRFRNGKNPFEPDKIIFIISFWQWDSLHEIDGNYIIDFLYF